MRLSYILIVLLLFFSPANSQYKYGGSLPDSLLIVVNSKSNILYVGIDNPIELNLEENEKFENYFLYTNNGLAFVDSLQFIVIPNRNGISRLVLLKINGDDTTIIGQKFYHSSAIPDPKLQIDTLKFDENSKIYKNQLLAADSVSIFISSDIKGSEDWFRITRFTIGYIYGGLYKYHNNPGNRLSNETKLVVNRLGPGKELIFKLFAKGEGNLIIELPVYRLELY